VKKRPAKAGEGQEKARLEKKGFLDGLKVLGLKKNSEGGRLVTELTREEVPQGKMVPGGGGGGRLKKGWDFRGIVTKAQGSLEAGETR